MRTKTGVPHPHPNSLQCLLKAHASVRPPPSVRPGWAAENRMGRCCLGPVLCWSAKQPCFEPALVCELQRVAAHLSKATRMLGFAQVVQAGGGPGPRRLCIHSRRSRFFLMFSCHPLSHGPDVLSCSPTRHSGKNRHQEAHSCSVPASTSLPLAEALPLSLVYRCAELSSDKR